MATDTVTNTSFTDTVTGSTATIGSPSPLTHHMDLTMVKRELGLTPRDRYFQNVGSTERMVSSIGGALLAGLGLALTRRTVLGGVALAAIGVAAAERGLTGHCSIYKSMGINTAENQ